jgi:hypothetical protein
MWALAAKTGERIIYAHRAHSAVSAEPDLVRTDAFRAHTEGLVFLAQRRTKHGWDYEATRISPKTSKVLALGADRRGIGL